MPPMPAMRFPAPHLRHDLRTHSPCILTIIGLMIYAEVILLSHTIYNNSCPRYATFGLSIFQQVPWQIGRQLNTLPGALEKSGQWQRSLQILLSMIPRQIRPDPMTCNSATRLSGGGLRRWGLNQPMEQCVHDE